MGQYDRQIASVDRMIKKFGQVVTFKRFGPDITKNICMVFISPSASGESQFGKELLQYLSGTQVASGCVRGYCAPFKYTPKLNDIFIRDGKELIIKAVDTIKPGSQEILHIVEFSL